MSTSQFTPPLIASRCIGLMLHTSGVIMLVPCLQMAVKNLRVRKNWRFWLPTLLGLLLLLVTCLIEITFVAGYFDGFKAFMWTPIHTLSGDVTVRLGVMITASLRLWRLYLIVQERNQKIVLASMFCVCFVMLLTLGFTIDLRAYEAAVLLIQPRPLAIRNALIFLRTQESLVSFLSFFIVKIFSIAADIVFITVLMENGRSAGKNARKLTKTQILSPYLINVLFSIVYLIVVGLTRIVWDSATYNFIQFTNITLNRFCPALEAFIFYRFTINQSRHLLLRGKSKSGLTTRSSQVSSVSKRGVAATASVSQHDDGGGGESRPSS
ncbi:hypothetical protein BCR44DRAFT_37272 [Catenaria anguillulae PL171]|uniref:Uncharacterized protein n=1 Tax=Catenaria anguillulae PL171 TaxID=765915 RepID=A0A1Y2HDB8_9FUNG|nr:hypothetical protein BCR44DRAFT_37272 [Catenaria anguillulae PL171]